MTMCATGHRPNKLWGYNIQTPEYYNLAKLMSTEILKSGETNFISGMALGVDTIFALVVIKLRDTTHPEFKLECACPCANFDSKWFGESRKQAQQILSVADKITYVSTLEYTPACMQARNIYMVDNSDIILAIWDGTSGGTANCVRYAESVNKPIVQINPKQI